MTITIEQLETAILSAHKRGTSEERQRTLKLIDKLLPKYYEDGVDVFVSELKDALEVLNDGK